MSDRKQTMSRVSADDFEQAAQWLDECDINGMTPSCIRVAQWLRVEATRRHKEAAIRGLAREKGLSTASVRRALNTKLAAKGAGQ